MTAERWARLQSLFGDALSLSELDRASALERLRSDQPELAADLARLLDNHARASSYLESPVASLAPHILQIGDLVAERFEILRFLGAGGMGQVYQARDSELGESIALKILPEHFVANERMLDRFRQEVQVSRRVTHPNVCRMFDLGKFYLDGLELYFLTMELVGGESLAERLVRGPIPVEEAKLVLLEILDGLEAAHNSGVLHRDLKPANIMLRAVPLASGHRVVITDFGLARQMANGMSPSTQSGRMMVGTPLYMAPEQIEGGPATPQTDLYAFGLVAHEVFTGRPLGGADNPLGAIVKRSRSRPDSIRGIAPEVGRQWDVALLRCLDPNPDGRPANVSELRSSLNKKKSVAALVTFPPSFTRRKVMAAGFTLAAATAAGFGVWSLRRSTPILEEGARLMLAPSENLTKDGIFDSFGIALRGQLAQSSHFSVVEPAEFPDALKLMLKKPGDRLTAADVRHLALRLDVPMVLHTTLSRVGSSYSLQFLVERVAAGSALPSHSWSNSFLANNPREVFGALNDASLWLRQITGEPEAAINLNSKRPEEVTTDSWEALRDFTQGQSEVAADKRESGLTFYASAIRRDPLFVMAHMRRGDILINLGREEEGLRAWTEAISAVDSRPCSRREELAIRAMYSADTGDFAASVKYYEEMVLLYPSDPRPWRFRKLPLALLNRRREAVEIAKRYVQMVPPSASSWFQLATAAIFASDFSVAATAVQKLLELGHRPQALGVQFQLSYQQSNYDAAEEQAREAVAVSERLGEQVRVSEYSRRLAHYLADRNRPDDAVSLLAKGAAKDERQGNQSGQAQTLVSMAYLELERHKPARVRDLCRAALNLDPSVERYRRCGPLFARAGFGDDASQVASKLNGFPQTHFVRAASLLSRGELALARGNEREAARLLGQADEILPPAWAKEHWKRFAAATHDRGRAQQANQQVIDCKGACWLMVQMDWPGIYGHAVQEFDGASIRSERALLQNHKEREQ
jgi:eukaryotic-like serine/threonine-protein kinase